MRCTAALLRVKINYDRTSNNQTGAVDVAGTRIAAPLNGNTVLLCRQTHNGLTLASGYGVGTNLQTRISESELQRWSIYSVW